MAAKKDYSVVLEGVDARDLSMAVLRDLCDLVLEGSQRSARLAAEGSSVARGAQPSWVAAAADCRITKFEAGPLALSVQASPLVDVAPEIFAQKPPFPSGTDSGATAFDLFLDAAEDAAAGRRDSERLDAGVLDVLARTGGLFSTGGTRLTLAGAGHTRVVLDANAAQVIRTLAEGTPSARISRVRGVLDMLTVSTKTIALRLADGRIVRGFAGSVVQARLKALLGTDVVLEGLINFRPSGDAQRIEVDSILPATPGDVIWSQLPPVEPISSRPRVPAAPVGLDAFFGKWPGDESDQQLTEALRDLQ